MKGIHILDTSRILGSYCHFQIHAGHTQTFHKRGSKCPPCAVARDVPLLIRDPYTRKRGVLGYMFVESFTFVMVQRTLSEIWPRFFRNILCRVSQKPLNSRDSVLIEIY